MALLSRAQQCNICCRVALLRSWVGGKKGKYKKKPYRIFIGAVSMCWRVENSIAARRTISVGSWVFLVDEWDRHLRWPVEEVRLGSIVAV